MTDKLKEAIEVLKQHKSTTDKFNHTVGNVKVSEAIDTVVAHLTSENKSGLDEKLDEKGKQQSDNQCQCSCKKDEEYYSKYSEGLQKTVIPHIDKIERLIKKQQRKPQDQSWFIAEASSIVTRAFQKGVDFGYNEGRKNGKG